MKNGLILLGLAFGLTTTPLFAGASFTSSQTSDTSTNASGGRFPFEFEVDYTYIGEGEVERESNEVDELEEHYASALFVYTPRIKFGILRLGARYERFEFEAPEFFEVPGRLQSASAVIGLDTQFSDSLLVRIEAQPGFYSSRVLDSDDFNVPFIIGGTYIYNSNLQFVLGVSVDFERSAPVIPGGGVRWRLASQWLLNAVLPSPRLEFEATKNLTVYAGADIKGSTFRVDEGFGDRRGNPDLNHAVITYTELRLGAGVDWKISPDVKISFEGGYLAHRTFDFHRTDVRYHFEEGAPYAAAALRAAF